MYKNLPANMRAKKEKTKTFANWKRGTSLAPCVYLLRMRIDTSIRGEHKRALLVTGSLRGHRDRVVCVLMYVGVRVRLRGVEPTTAVVRRQERSREIHPVLNERHVCTDVHTSCKNQKT